MATSKSFFGLRRGSTRSLTFSVLNGKQVTKERVSYVRNPNTIPQRLQRMKFLNLQLLLKAGLSGIIDHSWQNVSYGNASRHYFMSRALKVSGPYIGRDQQLAVPMPVQISEGSLPSLSTRLTTQAGAVANLDVILANGIAGAMISAGEQVTIVYIANGIVETARCIVEDIAAPAGDEEPWTISYSVDHNDLNVSADEDQVRLSFVPSNKGAVWGYAVIRSAYRYGQWQRSTEKMVISTAAESAFYSVGAMNVAIDSWDTSTNANMLSDWYLNLSESVYDGADVVISVATSGGGRSRIRARMVSQGSQLVPYIYTTDGTSAGFCITESGNVSSIAGANVVGAVGFVLYGSVEEGEGPMP